MVQSAVSWIPIPIPRDLIRSVSPSTKATNPNAPPVEIYIPKPFQAAKTTTGTTLASPLKDIAAIARAETAAWNEVKAYSLVPNLDKNNVEVQVILAEREMFQ